MSSDEIIELTVSIEQTIEADSTVCELLELDVTIDTSASFDAIL